MELIYPKNIRAKFTNRDYELRLLNYLRMQHLSGNTQHVVLFGMRRIGKTLLLKEFILRCLEDDDKIISVYLDFEEITSSPEHFAIGYIGQVCFWFLTRGQENPEDYLTMNSLFAKGMASPEKVVRDAVDALHRELEKARTDRVGLLRNALSFPEQVALATGKKILAVIDEFQTVELLNNYKQTPDMIQLFRANLQRQSHVLYILAGSAISVITRLVSDQRSPLFLQFQKLPIKPFNPEDSYKFARKMVPEIGKNHEALEEIHRLSFGNPFYINQICQRLLQLKSLHDIPLSVASVKQAFIIETLSSQGRIYDFCRYIYDVSLQKAKGYGSLKSILRILSEEEGLSLTEIARQQKVTLPTASDYVRWLLEVDLVIEKNKRYYFADPVFRYWVTHATRGVEVDYLPRKEDIWELVKKLDERFQRVSTELGIAIEAKVLQIIQAFDGREVSGSLFYALSGDTRVVLPKFKNVQPYRSADNQIEIDLVAENAQKWGVEVKWRTKAVGKKELRAFEEKSRGVAEKLWVISKSGFTSAAVQFASTNKILLSDRISIEVLAEMLGVRFMK